MSKKGRRTVCRKACCWSPFGTCCKHGICACHMEGFDQYVQAVQDSHDGVVHLDELRRRRDLRRK